VQGLKAALALQPQGLWFVASARKASVLLGSLVASGEDPAAVARIVAPAGEFIGAQTPEEIALSVLSSVVAARRGHAPAPARVVQAVADAVGVAAVAAVPSAVLSAVPAAVPAAVLSAETQNSCCGGAPKTRATAQAPTHAVSAVADHSALPALAPVAAHTALVPAATPLAVAKKSCCGG
jgi:xanthine dehydrogenase accessory factor